MVMMMMMFDEN